jgi:phosphatidylglycerophosphate synthase
MLVVSHANRSLQRAGGITVLERQLWTIARAGFKKIWIGMPRPALALRFPPNLDMIWSDSSATAELNAEPPYVSVSADYFVRVETLRYVAQSDYPAPAVLEDESGRNVLQVMTSRADRTVSPERQRLPEGGFVRLENPVRQPAVESWLLTLGIKDQDGFMARHFDRYLSLAVSRALLETPVTPNMMTLMSSLIGLVGAAFFTVPTHAMRLAGALLVLLHSVLDGCDGELARIRFQESPLGADIDFWGDNVVHVALFSCMAWGFYKADQNLIPPALGLLSAIGTIGSAALNYRERLERRRDPHAFDGDKGIVTTLTRVENMLAARDFIYLLVLLAYFDRLYEFMCATAAGSLLFFFMMLYLGRKHDEQAKQPHPAREGQAGSPAAGHGSGHQHLYSGR